MWDPEKTKYEAAKLVGLKSRVVTMSCVGSSLGDVTDCYPPERCENKVKKVCDDKSSVQDCIAGRMKPSDMPERQSSHKENICLTCDNEGNIVNRMSESFDKNFPTGVSRKLPPFRTGKYTPKDDVYDAKLKSEKTILVGPKPKRSSVKPIPTSSGPQPFRLGKYIPDDSHVYSCDTVGRNHSPTNSPRSTTQSPIQSPRSKSPLQKSPIHKAKASSLERLTATANSLTGYQNGRHSPDCSRLKSIHESSSCPTVSRTVSQEVSTGKSSAVNSSRINDRMSQSAKEVSRGQTKSWPKSSVVEKCSVVRARTQSENAVAVKPKARPKSSVLELSSQAQKIKSLSKETWSPAGKNKTSSKSQAYSYNTSCKIENSCSVAMPGRTGSRSKVQSQPKSSLSDPLYRKLGSSAPRRTPSNESDRFLRKGSDSSDRKHHRSRTVSGMSSSCSERIPTARLRKARRIPQRNAYVKQRRRALVEKTSEKQDSKSLKAEKKSEKREMENTVPVVQKPAVYSLLLDKYCVRCMKKNGDMKIRPVQRCRVMAQKLKRIHYLLYEKVQVLILSYFGLYFLCC